MKVFLSHPMYGTSGGEVLEIREKAYEYLKNKYGEDVKQIDNYSHEDAPENAGRLWNLGRSIQRMEEADAIYFCGDWEDARGCCIEERVARYYGLKVLE